MLKHLTTTAQSKIHRENLQSTPLNYIQYNTVCNSVFHSGHFEHGALGRAVEHSTSDHWVPGSKPGIFKSGALSSFISLPGAWSVTQKILAVKKRR